MYIEDQQSHIMRDYDKLKTLMRESEKSLKLERLRLQDEIREIECFREHAE